MCPAAGGPCAQLLEVRDHVPERLRRIEQPLGQPYKELVILLAIVHVDDSYLFQGLRTGLFWE